MRIIEIYLAGEVEGKLTVFGDKNVKDKRQLKGDKFAGVVCGCEVYYNPRNLNAVTARLIANIIIKSENKDGNDAK